MQPSEDSLEKMILDQEAHSDGVKKKLSISMHISNSSKTTAENNLKLFRATEDEQFFEETLYRSLVDLFYTLRSKLCQTYLV